MNSVVNHFPKNEQTFREKMLDMEEMWQFPCCWSAIDGCHISIKCPPGGLESSKEYHNFKNIFSIVLMGMVDAKYRFIWASCGYPGNSHDSIIMQSTTLWQDIRELKHALFSRQPEENIHAINYVDGKILYRVKFFQGLLKMLAGLMCHL